MHKMSSNNSKDQRDASATVNAGSEGENARGRRSSGGAGAQAASRETSPNDSTAASGAALVKEVLREEGQSHARRTRRKRSDGPDANEVRTQIIEMPVSMATNHLICVPDRSRCTICGGLLRECLLTVTETLTWRWHRSCCSCWRENFAKTNMLTPPLLDDPS